MRAVNRIISTSFWEEERAVNEFSPEDKYFYLYLLTNPHTTQLGIYNLVPKTAAFELGYSVDVVKVLLERFEKDYSVIKRSGKTSEIIILDFLKHSIVKGGKPVFDCLQKEEKSVNDKSLLWCLYKHLSKEEELNITVKEYLMELYERLNNTYNSISINDNERIVDESWTNRGVDTDFSGKDRVMTAWNTMAEHYGLPVLRTIIPNSQRHKWLRARIAEYGEGAILEAIANVGASEFLRNSSFFSFDWMIRPNNFPKVLEGNYGRATKHETQPEPAKQTLPEQSKEVPLSEKPFCEMTEEELEQVFGTEG